MLQTLSIRNVVLIEALDLSFESGFCVLTGETGAGKSILLDALCLVLGQRGEQNLIRKNVEQASVFAEFEHDSYFDNFFEEQGLPKRDVISLRRVLQTNGRSKAFINDESVTAQTLKILGDQLINIHGQQDHLFELSRQRVLLDQAIDLKIRNTVEAAHEHLQTAIFNLKAFEESISTNQSQKAFLKMQLEDLKNLSPVEGEETLLLQRREAIVGFAKIADTVASCLTGLTFPKDLASEIAQHQQTLTRSSQPGLEALEEAAKSLDRAYIEVKETQQALRDLLDQHQAHAKELQAYDQRYSELHSVAKKYNIAGDDLYNVLQNLQGQQQALDDPEYERTQLQKQLSKARQEYIDAAQILSKHRTQAASALENNVHKELPDLFLPHARFRTNFVPLSEAHWSAYGVEQVVFEVCMNPGQLFTPLHKTASGGEMARLMLALKVATANQHNLSTLIFDEIDHGVSGSVALAIGRRLRRLGKCGQVMAITHSAQVASQAEHHLVVEKQQEQTTTATTVQVLSENERVSEIARMLSGNDVNDAARMAAIELMKELP
ncbi:MAG: DNA repair protein RecN [Alphaproteobacteria bacterium]